MDKADERGRLSLTHNFFPAGQGAQPFETKLLISLKNKFRVIVGKIAKIKQIDNLI